jgi:hypothetical protein
VKHVKRISGFIGWLLAFLVLFIGVFVGVLVWRIAQGPVSLHRITPFLVSELNKSSGDLAFDVDDMVLVWRGWEEKFDLRLKNATVHSRSGPEVLRIPAADVVFSTRALLHGVFALREIDLISPKLRLIRHADGRFDIGLTTALDDMAPTGDVTVANADAGSGTDKPAINMPIPDKAASDTPVDEASMAPSDGKNSTPTPTDAAKTAEPPTAKASETDTAKVPATTPSEPGTPSNSTVPSARSVASPDTGNGKAGTDAGEAVTSAEADNPDAALAAGNDFIRQVVAILAGEDTGIPAAAYFEKFGIFGADVEMVDHALGVTWSAPDADIRLVRRPTGIDAEMNLSVQAGAVKADVDIQGRYLKAERRIDLNAKVGKVIPADFSTISSEFIGLDRFDIPVWGTLRASLHPDGGLIRMDADLDVGQGNVQLPVPLNAAYKINGGKAMIDFVPGEVNFRKVTVHTGENSVVDMTADIKNPRGKWAVNMNASVTHVATNDLPTLWPETLGEKPRKWVVENLSDGEVHKASIALDMHRGENGNAVVDKINGDMTMSGVTVQYIPGMPEVKGAGGSAEFDHDSFVIHADRGTAAGIEVDKATLDFNQLDTDTEWANIEIVAHGGVRDALELIDHKPLGFASRLGIDPKQVSGEQATRVQLSFPLKHDLDLEDIDVAAAARIKNAKVAKAFRNLDVSNGNFELQVNPKGLELSGDARLGNGRNTLKWVESFDDKTPLQSDYKLGGTFDLADLQKVGLESGEYLSGTADGNVEIQVAQNGKVVITGATDLAKTGVTLDAADYRKTIGDPGKADFKVTFFGDGGGQLDKLNVSGPDLSLNGQGRWRGTNNLDDKLWFSVDHARFRENRDVSGTVTLADDNSLSVDLKADQFDLRPFVEDRTKGSNAPDGAGLPTDPPADSAQANTKTGPDAKTKGDGGLTTAAMPNDVKVRLNAKRFLVKGSTPTIENGVVSLARKGADTEVDITADQLDARPWVVSDNNAAKQSPKAPNSGGIGQSSTRFGGKTGIFLQVKKMLMARDQEIGDLRGSIHVEGTEWRSIVLDGSMGQNASVFAMVKPGEDGQRTVQLSADDAGKFLAAIDLYGDMRGGRLSITGKVDDHSYDQPFTGKANITDFRIVNAPLAAKVLNAASLFGLVDALGGKGISFDKLDGEFTYSRDVLSVSKVAANGAAIGVTANGKIDLGKDEIQVAGSIVPFYALNSVLGNIPILGDLLVGEKGGGLFAPTYTVEGPVEDPDIDVNPLSTIVPGVFRNLITGATPGN